jgi:hypothetical protein
MSCLRRTNAEEMPAKDLHKDALPMGRVVVALVWKCGASGVRYEYLGCPRMPWRREGECGA